MALEVAANVEALRRFGFGIRLTSGNDEKKRVCKFIEMLPGKSPALN